MEQKKFILDNIKVAIFDFDDTLAIHKDKQYREHRKESEEKYLEYYLNAYLNPNTFYEDVEPCIISEKILELINNLRKNNVKIYCVSGMKFSFHFKAKEYFVHKYYGEDIEVISTRNQELKVDATKIISMLNNCSLNEILFVDDIKENIKLFNSMGINALLPSDIEKL